MSSGTVVFFGVVLTLFIASLFVINLKDSIEEKMGPAIGDYEKRNVMSKYERSLYYALITVINGEFLVLAQVQMTGFMEPRGGKGRYARLNKIHRKSVDFLICDKETMQPIAAIELQDWTHGREDRKRADWQKAAALKAAGVPLILFDKLPTYSEVDERIEPFRKKN